jgi:hypothetical protein
MMKGKLGMSQSDLAQNECSLEEGNRSGRRTASAFLLYFLFDFTRLFELSFAFRGRQGALHKPFGEETEPDGDERGGSILDRKACIAR